MNSVYWIERQVITLPPTLFVLAFPAYEFWCITKSSGAAWSLKKKKLSGSNTNTFKLEKNLFAFEVCSFLILSLVWLPSLGKTFRVTPFCSRLQNRVESTTLFYKGIGLTLGCFWWDVFYLHVLTLAFRSQGWCCSGPNKGLFHTEKMQELG